MGTKLGKLKYLFVSGFILIIISGLFFNLFSCSSKSVSLAPLNIGTTISEANALIYIARDQGYFGDNGLKVNIKVYASGKAATDDMLKGVVDMANSSEYAFITNILAGNDVRDIATINRNSIEYLVGRTDKGVNGISDLRGKKVGVPMESRPEFALGRFLEQYNISAPEVDLVNVSVDQTADALINGDVDAVATWEPYISIAREAIGKNNVVTWSIQSNQPSYNGVVCTAGFTDEHPDLIIKFLKAVNSAESYTAANPEEAKAIIQKNNDQSDSYMAAVWPENQFSISLDQSLITAMEDETRWMIDNNLTTQTTMPDYTQYIYTDGLRIVKPEAVNIIR